MFDRGLNKPLDEPDFPYFQYENEYPPFFRLVGTIVFFSFFEASRNFVDLIKD